MAAVPDFGMVAAMVMAIVIKQKRNAIGSVSYPKVQVNMEVIIFVYSKALMNFYNKIFFNFKSV